MIVEANNIISNEKWQPTREDYFKLEEKYRDLENRYIRLYNKYCRKPLQKRTEPLTDKERYEVVSGRVFECIKPITNVRKGSGCDLGYTYWFEYVHDTNHGENPDADAFYRILSEHNHLSEVYITDDELANNFREI